MSAVSLSIGDKNTSQTRIGDSEPFQSLYK